MTVEVFASDCERVVLSAQERRVDECVFHAVTRSVEHLLARRGIAVAPPTSPDAAAFGAYWERASRVIGDTLALEVASDTPVGGLGLMSYAIASASTLGEAVDALRETFLPRALPGMRLLVVPVSRERVDLQLRGSSGALRAMEELLVAVIMRHFSLLERPVVPTGIALRRPAPFAQAPWRRFFGIAPRFGRGTTAMRLDRVHLRTRLRTAAPVLHRVVRDLAMGRLEESFSAKVREYVRLHVKGAIDASSIADALRTTARTLQRRLQEEDTSLRTIVLDVRVSAARELLERTDAPVADIAAAVGFGVPSSFSRVFTLATGESPAVYRRRRRV